MLGTFIPFTLWNIICAVAPNTPVLLIFRLLAGMFGSSPLSNAGGSLADIWRPHERAVPSSILSSGPWFGPSKQTSLFNPTPLEILTSTSLWAPCRSRFIQHVATAASYQSVNPLLGILDEDSARMALQLLDRNDY